ncbi:MAG: ergothioneine biosynthesis protein EgtB [Myxococcales bacterium]|nr:ergothioneine biosynthesis protein EgtB [Myxococcales bacterium]
MTSPATNATPGTETFSNPPHREPKERDSGALLRSLRQVRAQTEALADPLSAEDCAIQSMPDASPTKWHLAHTTWFFETFVLEDHLSGYKRFDPSFRFLFNSYYNNLGEQYPRPERGLLSRPSLAMVEDYRGHVDRNLERFLRDLPEASWDRCKTLVEIGMHHEQQHQELILTDVKHMLSHNPAAGTYAEGAEREGEAGALRWVAQSGGRFTFGHDGAGFFFDNEKPAHDQLLRPFELASRPATNAEYLDFIRDGGYETPTLWLSEGWGAIQERKITQPLYWFGGGEDFQNFTLSGLSPVDPEEPVTHVSYYEADAFARWSGARLPTEYEWEHAAGDAPATGNLLETGRLHPGVGVARSGLTQLYGDVWEWTQSPYSPYPGFRAPAGALCEYNGKFMCNQFVLRGGSCATPRSHIRKTYRNFFPADARWQFSGIRLARDL